MMNGIFFILLAHLATGSGQTPPQTAPPIRVESNLVELEVLVTDSKGRFAQDVPREAFRVREDGVPQTIELFRFERRLRRTRDATGSSSASRSSPLIAPSPRRYTIWAVDHLNTDPADAYRAQESMLQFLKGGLAEGEVVAIVSLGRGIEFVSGFTDDASLLATGIERLSRRVLSGSGMRLEPGQLIQEIDRCRQMSGPARRGDDSAFRCALSAARAFSVYEREKVVQALYTYRALASSLAGLEGSKRAFVFSGGFPLMPGEVAFSSLALFFPGQAMGERSTLVNQPPFVLREVVSSATRANVSFYTIDARGLIATPLGGDASERGMPLTENPGGVTDLARAREDAPKDGLSALATETGGRFFHNSNDLAGLLQRAYDHGAEYYLIGYYSANRTLDGRFRRIQVDLPGTNYKGRTRAGYFATPSLTIPAQAEILTSDASVRDGFVVLPYHVKLGAASLHFERKDKERVGALSVQGRVYSAGGAPLGEFFDFFSPKISKGGKTPDTVQYANRISASPGSYRLVLHFRDISTGAVASIDQTIEVPVHEGLAGRRAFLEHLRAGQALYSAGKYREAADSLARAVEADPMIAGARVDLAMALLGSGSDAEADRELSRAIEIDPRYGAGWMGRASLRFKQQRFVEAREDAAEAVRLLPSSGRAHYLLGAMQEALHAYADAAKSHARAIELEPDRWDAYMALARLLAGGLGRAGEAISILEKYLARGGPDPDTARSAIARLRNP